MALFTPSRLMIRIFKKLLFEFSIMSPVATIQTLGKDARGGRLAYSSRSGEQIRMSDAMRGDRVAQGMGYLVLPDQFAKRFRPVTAGHHDVLARGAVTCRKSGARRFVRYGCVVGPEAVVGWAEHSS